LKGKKRYGKNGEPTTHPVSKKFSGTIIVSEKDTQRARKGNHYGEVEESQVAKKIIRKKKF